MFYIHQSTCISAQNTFGDIDLSKLEESVANKLFAKEPAYEGIPLGLLRRMGKAVRLGVGSALPLINVNPNLDGIVIGTANGGMEDCIKFLNQIIDYEEGRLTPTNFVQSSVNAIAAQLSFLSLNKGYNITHVHRGLSFENAIIDIEMLLAENPTNTYLLGGVDEVSDYNYNLEYLSGWYKDERILNTQLYKGQSKGSIVGEGAAMFVVSNKEEGANAKLAAISTFNVEDESVVASKLKLFLEQNLLQGEKLDLILTGENGDNRLLKHYHAAEKVVGDQVPIARFKHFTGEYQTASAISLWLSTYFLNSQTIPLHFFKGSALSGVINKVLVYNTYKGNQHSFMLVSKV
jgi:hypothetical protein